MTDLAKLFEPFPPESISWRIGSTNQAKTSGMALAFIDARDVMERLDQVCGPAGWQCRYPHANGKTVCEIGIKVDDEWVWKADGAGDSDIEAEKGALSDAFKRAAVRWGVGRYLYALGSPWVEIEQKGRSSIIKPGEKAKLDRVARGAKVDFPSPDAPIDSAAVDFAVGQMRVCKTAEDFKEFWETNKAGLRQQLTDAEYAKVCAAMREEAKRFAAADQPSTKTKEDA